jgi:polar amino acid transport system substrate-binding protein
VRLVLRNVPFETIFSDLTTGRVDLVVSGVTVTPERARTVAFSRPYYETVTCLLLSRARAAGVRGIADLDDPARTVVVKQGTTGEAAARERVPRARIRSYPTENAAALEVAQGRADAFLYDRASVVQHHRLHPETTILLEEPVTLEPYAIAARLGDAALVAWLDEQLRRLEASGRLEVLYALHGLDVPGSDR